MKTRIKELRLENNYTQEFLAPKVGITQTSLSRIECGVSIPDAYLLIQLSDLFQVSIDYILCLTDQRTVLHEAHILSSDAFKPFEKEIILLQGLNPIQRIHLQNFLESMQAFY